MKNVLVIFCCIVAVSNAIPVIDSKKEILTSNIDSNGPELVDAVLKVDGEANPSKRVARHYGFGGVSVGIGVPYIVPSMLFC